MAAPHHALTAAADVPMLVVSTSTSSERRISPSWTIAHFKDRLEPITGIPASCQSLSLRMAGGRADVPISAANEEAVQLSAFPLQAYAEINVLDTRPPSMRQNYTDTSAVPKYEMPASTYESLNDSVLHWKKTQKLGRFAPDADAQLDAQVAAFAAAVESSNIRVGRRCRLLPAETDARRGEVAYVGPVAGLPGPRPEVAVWVGVKLDEPVGKNDGRVSGEGKSYFDAGGKNRGVFVRPERVECGDQFGVVDEFASDGEMGESGDDEEEI